MKNNRRRNPGISVFSDWGLMAFVVVLLVLMADFGFFGEISLLGELVKWARG